MTWRTNSRFSQFCESAQKLVNKMGETCNFDIKWLTGSLTYLRLCHKSPNHTYWSVHRRLFLKQYQYIWLKLFYSKHFQVNVAFYVKQFRQDCCFSGQCVFVSAVMNLRVPWNVGNFLTNCKPVSFSRRTLHHGVSK